MLYSPARKMSIGKPKPHHTETSESVGMTVVVFAGAPLVANFFHDDRLTSIVRGLAFVFALQAPGVVAMAMLQRDLDFKSIAIAETVSYFLGFAFVGVVLAVNGVGVWSIVIAQLVQAALLTGILVVRRSHPRSLRPKGRNASCRR